MSNLAALPKTKYRGPSATAEDEGVLLSAVRDAARQHSFLRMLHAAHLTGRARAELPHHIPFDSWKFPRKESAQLIDRFMARPQHLPVAFFDQNPRKVDLPAFWHAMDQQQARP